MSRVGMRDGLGAEMGKAQAALKHMTGAWALRFGARVAWLLVVALSQLSRDRREVSQKAVLTVVGAGGEVELCSGGSGSVIAVG